MKERLIARPRFIWGGWVMYLRSARGSASPSSYWGGDPKATPQEAVSAYGARIVEAFPSFEVVIKGPTQAALKRAPEVRA